MMEPHIVCVTLLLSVIRGCAAHGAIVSPRSRNSIDYLAGVRGIDRCYNFSGPACENGQAAHYYSQGCTIGCAECSQRYDAAPDCETPAEPTLRFGEDDHLLQCVGVCVCDACCFLLRRRT